MGSIIGAARFQGYYVKQPKPRLCITHELKAINFLKLRSTCTRVGSYYEERRDISFNITGYKQYIELQVFHCNRKLYIRHVVLAPDHGQNSEVMNK